MSAPPPWPSKHASVETANAPESALERRIARILIACAGPMMPEHPHLASEQRARVDGEMERFLLRQIFSMPRYLLAPYLAALLAFDLWPSLRRGRRFCELDASARTRQIAGWSRSPLPQQRDLIKLIRNCALYFYLDHPLVRTALEQADGSPDGG